MFSAQLIGAISHVPGGIGVFESIVILSLSSFVRSDTLFSALIVYRCIYYLFPLFIGLLSFVIHEGYSVRKNMRNSEVIQNTKKLSYFVPSFLALVVFLSGALLIFSVATPSIEERLTFLNHLIPLQLLEFSTFVASLSGLFLIVISDALRRRVDLAYYITIILLSVGAAASLLKGFDWEEALVLSIVLLFVLPTKSLFFRRAKLLVPHDNVFSLIMIGTVFCLALFLGVFFYKQVQYSSNLWLNHSLNKNAPRSFRSGVVILIGTFIVWLRYALSSVPKIPYCTYETCKEHVDAILTHSTHTNGNLALLGDKYFFFSEDKTAFIMYGKINNMLVVMGDPIGEETSFAALLWTFYEMAHREAIKIVWYEISQQNLSLFIELGLHIYKLGEDAVVDLTHFTMVGAARKRLRPSRNKVIKEGYQFSVLSKEDLILRFDEIEAVSNEWLQVRKAHEKGFSLGYFERNYLAHFDCAIVEKEGEIVAFSNLWKSGDGLELSVDLMRYKEHQSNGLMDYLFIECLLWGKEHNFERFHLGMAPLSGLNDSKEAPLWNKGVNFLFQRGEKSYNFQGLRAFKNKFSPQWNPSYLAVPSSIPTPKLPFVVIKLAQLIGKKK